MRHKFKVGDIVCVKQWDPHNPDKEFIIEPGIKIKANSTYIIKKTVQTTSGNKNYILVSDVKLHNGWIEEWFTLVTFSKLTKLEKLVYEL